MRKVVKNFFLFVVYAWLRFDPIIMMAFGKRWTPRYEFMASIFGEEDSANFLKHRGKLVKTRNKKIAPLIMPSNVNKKTDEFLKANQDTKDGLSLRHQIIETLIFWALDPEINAQNIESYQTRSAIIDTLLGPIFQNSLADENEQILVGIKEIVFSRVTYLGAKGEPSPTVHNTIITGVGRILNAHFGEVARMRDKKLEDLTKIKLIKEIKKNSNGSESLAFSGGYRKNNPYRNVFPLPRESARMLFDVLKHYKFSAWPDSRDNAISLMETMERKLGFSIEENLGQ